MQVYKECGNTKPDIRVYGVYPALKLWNVRIAFMILSTSVIFGRFIFKQINETRKGGGLSLLPGYDTNTELPS